MSNDFFLGKAEHPWHAGELQVQRRAGSTRSAAGLGRMVRPVMTVQHVDFIRGLHLIVLSTVDADGRPWVSTVAGPRGRLAGAPDHGRSFWIDMRGFRKCDPLREVARRPGAPVGMLLIEPSTRRRNRVNGTAQPAVAGGAAAPRLGVDVFESFGNCPKYIAARDPPSGGQPWPRPPARGGAERGRRLSAAQRGLVRGADTLFIGTVAPNRDGTPAADASHRGGKPGFVRVSDDGSRVSFADYAGNGIFNTLGNIVVTGLAALAFVDWQTGAAVLLTGRAAVDFDVGPGRAREMDGAERIVDVEVDEVVELPSAFDGPYLEPVPDDGFVEFESPFNPRLAGEGAENAPRAAKAEVGALLVRRTVVADGVAELVFRALPPGQAAGAASAAPARLAKKLLAFQPGAYATFRLPAEAAGGEEVSRSWTLSGAPSGALGRGGDAGLFSITVKREPLGVASRFLHDRAVPGHTVLRVTGVGGDGNMSFFQEWPTLAGLRTDRGVLEALSAPVYSRVLVLTAGIGITPALSNLRSLAALRARAAGLARIPPMPEITLVHTSRTAAAVPAAAGEIASWLRAGVLTRAVVALTGGGEDTSPQLERAGVEVWSGRVGAAELDRVLPADRVASVFVCGPTAMQAATVAALGALGVPGGFVHTESFSF